MIAQFTAARDHIKRQLQRHGRQGNRAYLRAAAADCPARPGCARFSAAARVRIFHEKAGASEQPAVRRSALAKSRTSLHDELISTSQANLCAILAAQKRNGPLPFRGMTRLPFTNCSGNRSGNERLSGKVPTGRCARSSRGYCQQAACGHRPKRRESPHWKLPGKHAHSP